MKTSLKTLEGLKKALTVELPIADFDQKVNKILQDMAKEAKIDGFRKGKVPVPMLRQRFGASAKNDAGNTIISETLGKALEEAKVEPAYQPALTKIDSNDNTFVYTVEFEVFPEIKVADFDKLNIEQIQVDITPTDENKTLDGLKEQATTYKSVKRKSKKGDQLTIDFKGMIAGKTFDGGEAEGFKLVLGKGTMIVGFEEGLMDIASGKMVTLELTFPEQYQAQNLAGKEVVFEVNVADVATPQTPEEDVKLAKKFGEKDMESLKANMKKQMRSEADNRLYSTNKNAIFKALLDANEFEVPSVSVANESENLLKETQARMQQQGMDAQGNNLQADMFNEEAQRRVKLGLLVGQISTDNKLVASKAQIDEKLTQMSVEYGENAQQMIDYYKNNPQSLKSIELLVVEKMVSDLILAQAKVNIIDKKFEEITQH